MNNILLSDYINYDEDTNTLNIRIPKGLKIKIEGDINYDISGEYNINADKEMNLICHNGRICIDSNNDKGLHLNSYISKFSRNQKNN